MGLMFAIFLVLAGNHAAPAGPPFLPDSIDVDAGSEAAWKRAVSALDGRFTKFLKNPPEYRKRVLEECKRFPEGDLFPYLLPANAYAHLAISDPAYREKALRKMRLLIRLALPVVRDKVGADKGLATLKVTGDHGVYLCQLNATLGLYRLAGGDDRFEPIHKALSDAIHGDLVSKKGAPIQSFPGKEWPFDTIPCLLSLQLYDKVHGSTRSREAIRAHLEWIDKKGTDPKTGLPWSRVKDTLVKEPPRGCDLSWRISMLAHVDRKRAGALYDRYVKRFWVEQWVVKGFAEWEGGKMLRQDMDSGPLFLGAGLAASGFGVAATLAMGDEERFQKLMGQLDVARNTLKNLYNQKNRKENVWIGGVIPTKQEHYTGFLFGDAALFYSLTWTPLPIGYLM